MTSSIAQTVTSIPSRDPRMVTRNPTTARDPRIRDPRLQIKPSPVSATEVVPSISQGTTSGMSGPDPMMMPFPGMPPPIMPVMGHNMPTPGMMLHPPPGLFPPPVMGRLPPVMPPTSSMPYSLPSSQPPATQPPSTQTIMNENTNNQALNDRMTPTIPQSSNNSEKEKSVTHQKHSTEKGTLRSELERRAKENESEVKHKSDTDSHKQRSRDSKSKDRRSAENGRDSKERSKDSRSSRRSSPRHERGNNRDAKNREDDSKRKSPNDGDVKKMEEDRKRDSKLKARSSKSKTEDDFDSKDSNHSKRDKEKSPSVKDRSRSPVARKNHPSKEKKSPKKKEVVEKLNADVKTEIPEQIESEEVMDFEKRPGLLESGYKIPKKEITAEDKDLDERQLKMKDKDQKLVKENSKRDLSEIAESTEDKAMEEEGPSKKPRLEIHPKLDSDLRYLFPPNICVEIVRI